MVGRRDWNPAPTAAAPHLVPASLTCRRFACGGTWAARPCSAGRPRCALPGNRRSRAEGLSAPGRAAPPTPGSHRSCPARRGSNRPQPRASCRSEEGSAVRNLLIRASPGQTAKTRLSSAPARLSWHAASSNWVSSSRIHFRFPNLARKGSEGQDPLGDSRELSNRLGFCLSWRVFESQQIDRC